MTLECAIGMSVSCMTAANLAKARNTYKATDIILTSADLAPHADVAAAIHSNGMKAGYDLEMAFWVAGGFNTSYIPPNADANLAAIKAAGWDYALSEGLGRVQVEKIRQYLKLVNMGGENGEDVYAAGSPYLRPRNEADGNWLECYHEYAVAAYKSALQSAEMSTPANMGLTFMKYTQTADLEVNVPDLIALINAMFQAGVGLKKMHFWGGIEDACVLDTLDGALHPLWTTLNNTFGFSVTPTPQPIYVASPEILVAEDASNYSKFVLGSNKQLYWKHNTAGYVSLGGICTSPPGAASKGVGVLDVFVRGSDGGLYHKSLRSGVWGGWGNLQPALEQDAAISAMWVGSSLIVEVVGTNGAIYTKSWTPASGWSGWAFVVKQLA